MKRVILTDEPLPRRRAILDGGDDGEPPIPRRPPADDLKQPQSLFVPRPADPFDLTHPIRVPADVAKLASRFSHEAVAGLRLELHSRSGRARSHAAQTLLQLALHAPDAETIEAVETLTDEALDAQLAGLFKAEGTEEMMAEFGYLKARSSAELSRVRAVVNRPRGYVA
jgi:hypothetical protein